MSDAALEALAEAAGVQVRWDDARGDPQTVSPDSLRLILKALDLPASTPAEVADSRERLRSEAAAPHPLITGVVGRPIKIAGLSGRAKLRLHGEELRELRLDGGTVPAIDQPGYHTLETAHGQTMLAVAPTRAFTMQEAAPGRRAWGVGVQIYGLAAPSSPEFGDFGALARFAEACGQAGADAVAISPVHALFAADASRYSPYAPSSRLFLNGFYAAARTPPSATPPEGLVDWRSGIPAKLARLRADHAAMTPAERAAFAEFCAEAGQRLRDHAVFEALHGAHFPTLGSHGWQAWPEPLQDPRSPEVAAFAREHAGEVDFHLFLQWRAERSLGAAQKAARDAGMAVGLIADLAVGMDGGGSHAWSARGELLSSLSVGAPPDIFQPEGQDWGLAAFAPAALRAGGFQGFLATLRAAMRHAGGVRIDHAMGLKRLWVVPHGAGSTDGAYLSYPFEDMLRLLTLESALHQAVVVAEDLGTVPEGFRPALEAHGIMGMRVLSFERTKDGGFIAPEKWSPAAAALSTTHDLPTVAGWWSGRDIDWNVRLGRIEDEAEARKARQQDRGRLWRACVQASAATGAAPAADDTDPAVDAAIAFVAQTPCALALIAAEDLMGLTEQPNLPGTLDEHPNWRRRLPVDAAEPFSAAPTRRRIDGLAEARPRARPETRT